MPDRLQFQVSERRLDADANWKHLLLAFEALGGLTVATSMVGNNTHRLLDPDEFRGFALSDRLAPLVFVNSRQTKNAQLFTIAHEVAHIWRGNTGMSLDGPGRDDQSAVERWCNQVASQFLVPGEDLEQRHVAVSHLELTDQLERLARMFRRGTLVVLQALRRDALRDFVDFNAAYRMRSAALLSWRRRSPAAAGEPSGTTSPSVSAPGSARPSCATPWQETLAPPTP